MNLAPKDEIQRLEYSAWMVEYRPFHQTDSELLALDVISDISEVESNSPNKIWSEVWDFTNRKPIICSGVIQHHCGGVTWYLTEVPWSREVLVTGVPETPIFKAGMAVWSELWSMESSLTEPTKDNAENLKQVRESRGF